MRGQRGFTLLEMVVALALSVIVIGFAGMLITAPLKNYALQSERAQLVSSAGDAWPLLREDLRRALPNSARARRNGSVVVLEMLNAVDWVRYQSLPAPVFIASGTFRGLTVPYSGTGLYLSVNNMGSGVPGLDAYALSGSMSATGSVLSIVAGLLPGEQQVTIIPAPVFTGDSPRHRAYLVSGPVTWLCDESGGTLRRYAGYAIATNQAARDTAAELNAAGASSRLLATDISACDFLVGPGSASAGQLVSAHISATRNGQTVQLARQASIGNLP
jgi:MSHA biogenesis protein MshO